MSSPDTPPRSSLPRTLGRWALGVLLLAAGAAHLVVPEAFLAQVPPVLPARMAIVYVSGVVELALGAALVALPDRRVVVGWLVAALLVVVFPGNVSQAVTGAEAFGLETATARWVRLAFQPLLIVWALWSTDAWRSWRTGEVSPTGRGGRRPTGRGSRRGTRA